MGQATAKATSPKQPTLTAAQRQAEEEALERSLAPVIEQLQQKGLTIPWFPKFVDGFLVSDAELLVHYDPEPASKDVDSDERDQLTRTLLFGARWNYEFPSLGYAPSFAIERRATRAFRFGINPTGPYSGDSAKSLICYCLSMDPIFLFDQKPYGGSYMFEDQVKPPVDAMFANIARIGALFDRAIETGKLVAGTDTLSCTFGSWKHTQDDGQIIISVGENYDSLFAYLENMCRD